MRNVGPGVADRSGALTRGGSDEIVFGGEVQATIELDANGKRRSTAANGNLFTESLLAAYLLLPYGFAVNGVMRLEQTDKVPDGRGSVFREQTLWADELYLTWSRGVLDLFGGKIHPRFGSAWDRGPGLYGTDFGREYELTEKLGAGARHLVLRPARADQQRFGSAQHPGRVLRGRPQRAFGYSGFNARWGAGPQTGVDPDTGEAVTRTNWHLAQPAAPTAAPTTPTSSGGSVVSARRLRHPDAAWPGGLHRLAWCGAEGRGRIRS